MSIKINTLWFIKKLFILLFSLVLTSLAYAQTPTQDIYPFLTIRYATSSAGNTTTPFVILLQSSSGTNNQSEEWAKWFLAQGVSTVLVDSAKFRGMQSLLGVDYDGDVALALAGIKNDQKLDSKHYAIMGFSRGGTAALNANNGNALKAGGVADFVIALYPGDSGVCANTHPDNTRVHIFYGDLDDWGTYESTRTACRLLSERDKRVTYHELVGAYHGYDGNWEGSWYCCGNWFHSKPDPVALEYTRKAIANQITESRTNSLNGFSLESGWWWNANEPGRGYFIEARNGRHFTASYLYDNSGNPIWYVSGPDNVSGSTLPGTLGAYSGGQTLTGTYKAPAGPSSAGSMNITFSDSTHGTIIWPGGSVPITRYELGTGSLSLPDPSFKPETGWWWNASEGGRGFSIEVQGDNLFIAGFMYDGGGNPVWYVSAGKMTTPTLYQGTWAQYQNGQAMGGPARTASVKNANVGGVSISFSSTTTATLLLPDGRTLPLTRYPF